MKPIRILNLFTNMNYGGAETMVMNYYRNINRDLIQFDFMVHREKRGAYDDEIEALGGKIYRMIPIYPQNFIKYKKKISDFFDEHTEYQIIHSHMSELGYFVFQEAKKRGIPVRICHAHNAPNGWDLKMFVRTYFKFNIRRYTTDMFACGHDAGIWLFGKASADKFIVMNNAIDSKKYTFCMNKSKSIRAELGVSDELVIGHVGRFNPQKNHMFLIDIFKEIIKREPRAILLLVGDGDGKNQIQEKIKSLGLENKAIFTGAQPNVNELMLAMDIFVFPSLFEGLGIVAVEAQASGLHCVISEGVPDECIVTEGLVSKMKFADSPESWAEHILSEVKSKCERKGHYEEICKHGYDIVEASKWLEKFYMSIVGENK